MRFTHLAALALGLTGIISISPGNARALAERLTRQDRSSEITEFRDQEARDAARALAAKHDIQRLQGTWKCIRWDESGKATPEEELQDRVAFFGGEVCVFRQAGKLMQIASQKLDPTKTPRTITATVSQGRLKGEVLLGIYELERDTLRVCFDIAGQSRPTAFSGSAPGHVLAEFQRRMPLPTEELSLIGRYKSLSIQLDGSEHRADAVIQRRGDCYTVSYMKGSAVTYVGVGIRKGDTLSVCWANRGQAGVSVYKIEDGPNLIGQYTELGGVGFLSREILTFEEAAD